jgi:uncharacterized membrane protein
MNTKDSPRARTYVFMAAMVVFGSLGNVLLGKGMKQIGQLRDYSVPALSAAFLKIFSSVVIWMGIANLLLFLICYLLVLSWADLSFVQPASAIGYAMVALLGYLVLGELISPLRWTGILFICAGVVLVSGTAPRTTGG